MKILFIEDSDNWIREFLPQLQSIGEVIHFKSVHSAFSVIDEETFDLIVCDHNILLYENETKMSNGLEIYMQLRFENILTPFIHFSYEPCPDKYTEQNNVNFYSLKKESRVDLISFIKKINHLLI